MTRKLIAAFLIFAMLLPYSSAVAADKEAVTPTVEEILNEYHQKSFEAQRALETGTVSANSRSGAGSGKTLEQETVETLTAAGYEAYNVTADNYETLENQLQTDFAGMGLDSNSSYIVVVHGEEPNTPANNARGLGDIVQDPGDLTGGSGIRYTYEGITYTMRSITVTSNTDPCLRTSQTAIRIEPLTYTDYIVDTLKFLTCWAIDEVTKVPITGVMELFDGWLEDGIYHITEDGHPVLHATAAWNRRYTQVYDNINKYWFTAQCSSYVNVTARVIGSVYSYEIGNFIPIDSGLVEDVLYSTYYNRYERYDLAAQGFIERQLYRDYIDVGFYFFDSEGVSITGDGSAFVVLSESVRELLPRYEYDEG